MQENISEKDLPAALEALLFVSDEPVSALNLAKMFDISTSEVTDALNELQKSLSEGNRGIQLEEIAGGWRLSTKSKYHELLEEYVLSWDTRKLSDAACEVLAIVAYTQLTTRSQVSSLRGVNSDGPLNTLVERGYVKEAGIADGPGNPTLYATTRAFLEAYGLKSIKDLPPLDDFAPDEQSAQLIKERLGALSVDEQDVSAQYETGQESKADTLPEADELSGFGATTEKIDFDALEFNFDDE